MPQDFSRTYRIGEQIKRELADLVRQLKDPRVGMITITDVEVTKDLSHARVFFSVLGEDAIVAQTQKGLEHASGFLRRELGHALRLRITPQLHFIYDDTQLRGQEMDQLIRKALEKGVDDSEPGDQ